MTTDTLRVYCHSCEHMTLHDRPERSEVRPFGDEATAVSLRCAACSTRGDFALSHALASKLLAS